MTPWFCQPLILNFSIDLYQSPVVLSESRVNAKNIRSASFHKTNENYKYVNVKLKLFFVYLALLCSKIFL